ncbi:unnamed protein product [Symbiodinium pilosum]|uniref:Uncharacterized protein n=1 Tax=Symbiodinium pilosum TaxID=2952 RepID=A0A812XAH3_SYMPI|nr:unnamed protein product [Symbiodinium pilosum]
MGLRKSKPEALGASDPETPEEEPPSHLELASTEAASLLAQQRLAEAADVLFQSLRALEDQTELLSGRELVALGTALSAACTTLAWVSPPLSPQSVQLAFGASALVARLAMRVVRDRPEDLLSPILDHLQLFGGPFLYEGSREPEANKKWQKKPSLALGLPGERASSRAPTRLGGTGCQVFDVRSLDLPVFHAASPEPAGCRPLKSHQGFTALFALQYMFQVLGDSRDLREVWPLLSEPTAALLAASLQASCELAPSAPGTPGTSLLERVLRFQQATTGMREAAGKAFEFVRFRCLSSVVHEAWPKDAKSWEWQRPSLALLTSGRPLTPAHCLAAFMLSRLPIKAALSACLARDSGFLAQCTFTAALDVCEPGQHVELVAGLCETLVSELLPVRLLDVAAADLESHRLSALCQVLVPRFCLAIGKCAAALAEEVQVTRFAAPLEQWTLAVSSHAAARASGPARRWFTTSVFFAIATIAREAKIQQLGSRVLFKLLRAMSCVDMFREDSQEYRAICLSIVECGCAQGDDFHRAMLDELSELEATKNTAGVYKKPINSRLHFWLGMLATPSILENAMFFPIAWTPIVRISRTGELAIAARAVALAAMAIESHKQRSSDREPEVWQVLEAGLDGFAVAEGDEMLEPLHSLVEIIMAEQAGGKQALDSHRDLLKSLARRVLEHQEVPASTKPLGFFGLFCTAARSLDPSLSEAVFTDGRLGELLAEPSRRELWLRHLAARFPEKPRAELVRGTHSARSLARRCEVCAGSHWKPPRLAQRDSPLRAFLLEAPAVPPGDVMKVWSVLCVLSAVYSAEGDRLRRRVHAHASRSTSWESEPVAVEFFVMSKCPDAKLCEQTFLPVLQNLGKLVSVNFTYIADATPSQGPGQRSIQCMHGPGECLGNMQRLCVQKASRKEARLLHFAMCQDAGVVPDDGKACAVAAGFNAEEIEALQACWSGQEDLLSASAERATALSIKTSCTLRVDSKVFCVHDGDWKDCGSCGTDKAACLKAKVCELSDHHLKSKHCE